MKKYFRLVWSVFMKEENGFPLIVDKLTKANGEFIFYSISQHLWDEMMNLLFIAANNTELHI